MLPNSYKLRRPLVIRGLVSLIALTPWERVWPSREVQVCKKSSRRKKERAPPNTTHIFNNTSLSSTSASYSNLFTTMKDQGDDSVLPTVVHGSHFGHH